MSGRRRRSSRTRCLSKALSGVDAVPGASFEIPSCIPSHSIAFRRCLAEKLQQLCKGLPDPGCACEDEGCRGCGSERADPCSRGSLLLESDAPALRRIRRSLGRPASHWSDRRVPALGAVLLENHEAPGGLEAVCLHQHEVDAGAELLHLDRMPAGFVHGRPFAGYKPARQVEDRE